MVSIIDSFFGSKKILFTFLSRVKFEHETTDQGWRDLRDKWYFKKCFEQKNLAEWKGRTSSGGKLPATEACYAAMYDAASARHYHWEMDFVKVPIYFLFLDIYFLREIDIYF